MLVTIFAATCSLQPERSKPKNTGPSSEDPSNKVAIHLVARSSRGTSNKSSRIFRTQTYLPSIGLLESVAPVTIDSHGNVGEIKVLERMGVFGDWPADVTALKTLIRWRANPGPIRTVDISWSITPGLSLDYQRRIAYSKALTILFLYQSGNEFCD